MMPLTLPGATGPDPLPDLDNAPTSGPRRWLRWLAWLLLAGALLLGGLPTAGVWLLTWPAPRALLLQWLERAGGPEVTVAAVTALERGWGVMVRDLRVTGPAGWSLTLPEGRITLGWPAILLGRVEGVALLGPRLTLPPPAAAAGSPPAPSAPPATPPLPLAIARFTVDDGSVRGLHVAGRALALAGVAGEVAQLAWGGEGTLEGEVARLSVRPGAGPPLTWSGGFRWQPGGALLVAGQATLAQGVLALDGRFRDPRHGELLVVIPRDTPWPLRLLAREWGLPVPAGEGWGDLTLTLEGTQWRGRLAAHLLEAEWPEAPGGVALGGVQGVLELALAGSLAAPGEGRAFTPTAGGVESLDASARTLSLPLPGGGRLHGEGVAITLGGLLPEPGGDGFTLARGTLAAERLHLPPRGERPALAAQGVAVTLEGGRWRPAGPGEVARLVARVGSVAPAGAGLEPEGGTAGRAGADGAGQPDPPWRAAGVTLAAERLAAEPPPEGGGPAAGMALRGAALRLALAAVQGNVPGAPPMALSGATLTLPGWAWAGGRVTAPQPALSLDQGEMAGASLTGLSLTAATLTATLAENAWQLQEMNGRTTLARGARRLALGWRGNARGDGTRPLRLRGTLTRGAQRLAINLERQRDGGATVGLSLPAQRPFDLGELGGWFPAAAGLGGRLHGKLTLRRERNLWSGQGALTVAQLGWEGETPAGEGLLAGVSGTLSGQLSLDGEGPLRLAGRLSLSAGEWLVGPYYGSFADERPRLEATWRRQGRGWQLSADGGGNTLAGGALSLAPRAEGGYQGHVTLTRLDLGSAFQRYLRDLLAAEGSPLGRARVTGRLNLDVAFTLPPGAAPRLNGVLTVAEAGLRQEEGAWGVAGVALTLPIQEAGGTTPGRLTVAALHHGELALHDIQARPLLAGDTLSLAPPLALSPAGGRVTVEAFTLEGLWSPRRRLALSLALEAIDLESLTGGLGLPPLRGTLDGRLERLLLADGGLIADGSLKARVFGGVATASGFHATGLGGALPAWGMDLAMENLDLGRLTERLAVGKIQGAVSGWVRGLELAGLEPVAFDAHLATVASDAPHRISVTAINNIQLLGGGGAGGLERGLLGLFDAYRYHRLGFYCRLKNDRFHLSGIARRGGGEVLVEGSLLPPRVDVVSHNPVIGWRDMVSRLKTIGLAGGAPQVRTGPSPSP